MNQTTAEGLSCPVNLGHPPFVMRRLTGREIGGSAATEYKNCPLVMGTVAETR